MARVLAITGCMGSGKSTLVKNLQRLIPGSQVLLEDDYQMMTTMDPTQLRAWISEGSIVDELNLNGFDKAIRNWIQQVSSDSGRDPKLLIIESQFGRAHRGLKELVDYQFWIDAPLDMCLARKIVEFSGINPGGSLARMELGQIGGFCQNYLELTASLLRKQKLLVQQVSDHTLISERGIHQLVDQALEVLHQKAAGLLELTLD